MKRPPRHAGKKRSPSEEITGLETALQKAYARLRERARAAWERYRAGKIDPADASVSVRINATIKRPVASLPKPKPATRLLLKKPPKPRRKIHPGKGRRSK